MSSHRLLGEHVSRTTPLTCNCDPNNLILGCLGRSRHNNVWLLVLWVCFVCGCTLEPTYQATPLPVPDEWPTLAASSGHSGEARATRDIGWRQFFTDSRLQALIDLALANNRDLRIAVLNVAEVRAQYRIQRSALFPGLDASGYFAREKLPSALTYGIPSSTNGYYEVDVGVSSYEVDLFGRVRSMSHAALEEYLAQEQAHRAAQLSLVAEVTNTYLTLASDRELERLSEATLQGHISSFALEQRQHDAGTASGIETAHAQVTVDLARIDFERRRGNIALDIDALTLLIGTPIDPALLPDRFDVETMGISQIPAGLPSVVLLHRPDVLQAEHALRAANANIGAARADFFPRIVLTADIGTASEQLSNLFGTGTGTWIFAPQVLLPIFHAGALMSSLDVAHIKQKIALSKYENSIQSGFREVADALASAEILNRQLVAQQELVETTRRAIDIAQLRYHEGRDSYLDVLDSQREHYTAQVGLVSIRLAEQSNRVTLYKVLGGGWRE
jgi:multidrug efflux system outer membrane protein